MKYGHSLAAAVAVTALLLASLAPATARAAIDETVARQIYVESGARQQLADVGAQFPQEIRSSAEQSERTLPFTADEMEEAARGAYSTEATEKLVIAELQSQLQPADADEVLRWLRGDVGRRFTALEIEAGRAEAQAKMQAYAQSLMNNPPPESRQAIFESLQDALHTTEGATQLLMNMNLAIGIGFLDGGPEIDEAAIRKLRDTLETDRARMTTEVGPLMLVVLMYSYRDVPDADLQRYIDFARSPAGDRYHRAMIDGMDRALSAAGVRLGQELSRLSKSPNRKRQS
jgi:hypothetical protein